MSSEEKLIKAFATKMGSEDDLTSAAFHFCLSLYFYQSPFTCLSSPTLPLFPSFLCLRCRASAPVSSVQAVMERATDTAELTLSHETRLRPSSSLHSLFPLVS
ncbi:hypothetical protein KUCAC02_012243 [Chaenocephalus aceratus]|uniref:Uncharacterized protein n=1 Tax=Chaenocephalus aceratus TaxID=36190 RepID=A0ACB9XC44_CHAAC|nr:hypothetical protein KUCAC02_012243 [Chaenocephalus aceratus]